MDFSIRPMVEADLAMVTDWARAEGFCPGVGDAAILRDADRRGVWVGCLDGEPVGCILGVRYDGHYGRIGLFLVRPEHRGHGFGVALWERALEHLRDVSCIALEAEPDRIEDYSGWGFRPAWETLRWGLCSGDGGQPRSGEAPAVPLPPGWRVVPLEEVDRAAVLIYDARHEATPRPLVLEEWLDAGHGEEVLVVLDDLGCCRGFGRLRPCLLPEGEEGPGWRLGPLLADALPVADALLQRLCCGRRGLVLIDAPEANPRAHRLLEARGFQIRHRTVRMYRGPAPELALEDLYGLTCLELG
ncbi:MAG: GNAT family N-acetyltransferase [Cyanobium sp. ELA507]